MMAAQSFKSMAGAITVAEVITMDGVEAIIMDGAIVTGAIIMAITVGETSLPVLTTHRPQTLRPLLHPLLFDPRALANLAGWLRVTAAAISFPGGVEQLSHAEALATGKRLHLEICPHP